MCIRQCMAVLATTHNALIACRECVHSLLHSPTPADHDKHNNSIYGREMLGIQAFASLLNIIENFLGGHTRACDIRSLRGVSTGQEYKCNCLKTDYIAHSRFAWILMHLDH